MWISESSLVTVQPTLEELLELIVSPKNLNEAYKQVRRNGGAGGIDRMDVEALLPYLLTSHGKLYSVFQISLTHVRETSLVKVLNTFFPPYVRFL